MSAFASNFYTGCAGLKMCYKARNASFLVQINCDMIRLCALLLWLNYYSNCVLIIGRFHITNR